MTNGYDWSKPFDVNTVGLSGIIQMPQSKVIEEGTEISPGLEHYESRLLDIGVLISSLNFPWNETKTITFMP